MARRSEDDLGVKLDRCFTDITTKTVGGAGFGAGWINCRHELERPFALHGKKIQSGVDAQGKPVYTIVTETPPPKN